MILRVLHVHCLLLKAAQRLGKLLAHLLELLRQLVDARPVDLELQVVKLVYQDARLSARAVASIFYTQMHNSNIEFISFLNFVFLFNSNSLKLISTSAGRGDA